MDTGRITKQDTRNNSHQLVYPFYAYAALAFLVANILLFFSSSVFGQHFFHPHTLAITHIMALGWGTMMILGASHQLIPVLSGSPLYSQALGFWSFGLSAIGIPLLCFGFYHFVFNWTAILGAVLINLAIACFLVNVALSVAGNKKENVHSVFIFTATTWLLATTIIGLLLMLNFTGRVLPSGSLHYLTWHAHMGIVGWFLLLVIGVGSRLIPMFLVSKYESPKTLWLIFSLVNTGLISFIINFFVPELNIPGFFPPMLIGAGWLLFARYCFLAYNTRIRKTVDGPVATSLLAVFIMLMPIVLLLTLILVPFKGLEGNTFAMAYGFSVFFGWITAIILGMTFKTLPFIAWNKVYSARAGYKNTPSPKDLYNETQFRIMALLYLVGFTAFLTGIFLHKQGIIQIASICLILSAISYVGNVVNMILHKPIKDA